MINISINLIAVLVAALVSMGIGMLWYSPLLFLKPWLQASGLNEKKHKTTKGTAMAQTMFVAFLGNLLTSYVLAHFVNYTAATTAFMGAQTGFWLWLGFVAPVQLGSVLWEKKPAEYFLINTAHQMVNLLVMGAILAMWV